MSRDGLQQVTPSNPFLISLVAKSSSMARISKCSLIRLFAKNSGKANGTEGAFQEAAIRLDGPES